MLVACARGASFQRAGENATQQHATSSEPFFMLRPVAVTLIFSYAVVSPICSDTERTEVARVRAVRRYHTSVMI